MPAWSLSSNFLVGHANGQSLFLVLPKQVPQRHYDHPLDVQSHPSTGLLGSETGTNVALWTPALSVLPLSATGVMDGLRLSASDSSIPLMSKVNGKWDGQSCITPYGRSGGTELDSGNFVTGYPFLDVWRKKQGVACRMCPSAAILSKRAGAAKRVSVLCSSKKPASVQAYVQSDRPKKQNDSNFRFPHGSIAASKQTNTLAHGATKRIRIVIGSGRRSEAA
ncbi:hypothetical protein MY1884_008000 [Beauveria asiatica]